MSISSYVPGVFIIEEFVIFVDLITLNLRTLYDLSKHNKYIVISVFTFKKGLVVLFLALKKVYIFNFLSR